MTETRFLRSLVIFTLLLALGWFFFSVRAILLPFLLACILAYVLNPVVSFMELRGLRRETAVILLYAVIAIGTALLVYWAAALLWHDLPRLRYELPNHLEKLRAAALQAEAVLAEQWPAVREQHYVESGIDRFWTRIQQGLQSAPSVLSSLLDVVFYALLVPFVAFFLLRGGRGLFQKILDVCPARWVEKLLSLLYGIDEVLGNYLRGVLTEAFLVGLMSAVGLWALGVDHAPLIGAAAGLGNMVPYLGPLVGGALGALMAFFQFQNLSAPLNVILLFSVIQFIDGWVLEPLILKRAVDLHPILVFFALLCGGHLGGFWGLLLAVPIACVLKELIHIFSVWYMAEFGVRRNEKEIWSSAARTWIV